MARGSKKNKETKFPEDLDYLSYNTWSILNSAQFAVNYLYSKISIHLFLDNKIPGIVDNKDAIELFKALEPLRAFTMDEDRLKRAVIRKHKKEVN